jgi:hypothetical protein
MDTFRIKLHEPFQSGSTPWRGNRRYLSTTPSPLPLFSLPVFPRLVGGVDGSV